MNLEGLENRGQPLIRRFAGRGWVRHTPSESSSMRRRRIRWGLGILLLAVVQAAGCTSTVQGLKKRGVEVDVDRGEVKRVYRF